MKLTWQKRKRFVEFIRVLAIYILLSGVTASVTLNYLFYKDPLITIATETELTTIKDIEIKYVEKEVYLYFDNDNNQWQDFTITGYSANDPTWPQGTNNIVATGFDIDKEYMARLPIAASNCIPVYSIVEIEGMGAYIILDRGLGYITENGWEDENWIDILFDEKTDALSFGRQKLKVRVIN